MMFPRAFPRSFPQRSSTQRSDCLSDSCTPPILVLHPVCLLHLDLNLEDLIFLMPQTVAPRDKDHKTQEQVGCAVEQVVTRVGRGRWQEDGESHGIPRLLLVVPWIIPARCPLDRRIRPGFIRNRSGSTHKNSLVIHMLRWSSWPSPPQSLLAPSPRPRPPRPREGRGSSSKKMAEDENYLTQ